MTNLGKDFKSRKVIGLGTSLTGRRLGRRGEGGPLGRGLTDAEAWTGPQPVEWRQID